MSRAKAKSKAKAYQKSKKKGAMKGITVKSGGKLSVAQGGGLSEKGRKEINRKTGSNLKAPAPNPKTREAKGRKKSFCARMQGVVRKSKGPAKRARASMRRWKC